MDNEYMRVFRAFSDEHRLQVLKLLADGEKCTCVLLEQLNISQPTLSYHMKILCSSGIVRERQEGPWKYYSIDADGCSYAQKLLQQLSFSGAPIEIRLIRLLAGLSSAAKWKGREEEKDLPCATSCLCNC